MSAHEMSDEVDPRGGEIEVSPEEERFLKRFFRRQALPWFAAAVLIALTAAWGLRPEPGDEGLEVRVSAALAQLRSENEQLRAEVEALSKQVATPRVKLEGADELERRVEEARRNVKMIEARITADLDRRIDSLEAHVAQAGSQAAAPASAGMPADVSAWDASAILERLYALEMQQGQTGGGTDLTGRLAELERRLARVERPAAVPASSTP